MPGDSSAEHGSGEQYVVVARRYRPQNFQQLVGQSQVAQALHNAIATNRVGHAYLFTGARGVGKTSTARIFAKALNCERGPTSEPCNECEICQSITSGDDVDVIEIDGASNRGIDEIRQLRSNVNVRPSRARFKIYIIDEVHMLTTPAFNALLKTLEEPPEHVKFFFCTTDPEKIPITVLSRCQRFDFPPVEAADIVERLRFIVQSEGSEADDDALQLLARRAAGSMRDSQSLLEQLLAFSDGKITLDEVHRMLGSARGGQLGELAAALAARDAAQALTLLDTAIQEGADAGQLSNQLLGYFRDMLAAAVGCHPDLLLNVAPEDHAQLTETGRQTGVATLLAIVQLLDQAMTRMRQSVHVRTLLEVALVRICQLQELDDVSQLVANLRDGLPPAAAPVVRSPAVSSPASSGPASSAPPAAGAPDESSAKRAEQVSRETESAAEANPAPPKAKKSPPSTEKKTADAPVAAESKPQGAREPANLEGRSGSEIWSQALQQIEDTTCDFASFASDVAISGPNKLVVFFEPSYSFKKEQCERAERRSRIESALAEVCGGHVVVEFRLTDKPTSPPPKKKERSSRGNRLQARRETERHPLVSEAMEIFDAEMIRFDDERPRNGGGGA